MNLNWGGAGLITGILSVVWAIGLWVAGMETWAGIAALVATATIVFGVLISGPAPDTESAPTAEDLE